MNAQFRLMNKVTHPFIHAYLKVQLKQQLCNYHLVCLIYPVYTLSRQNYFVDR